MGVLHWLGRGVGWLVAAICLLIVASEVVWSQTPPFTEAHRQGVVLVGLILVTVLTALAALRWPRIGGTTIVIGAIALGIFAYITAQQNRIIAAVVLGGPFLLAGILFLMNWWGSRTSH